jgi:hypothetical protein
MVLMTSTSKDQATFFVEKLREKIAATDIAVPGSEAPVRITASGGLAMFPEHGQSTNELFEAADDALYEAKRQGRNRVCVATAVGLGGEPVGEAAASGKDAAAPLGLTDAATGGVEYSVGRHDERLDQWKSGLTP